MIYSRSIKRLVGTGLAASVAVLAIMAPASAHNPTGIFAKFAQCPLENPKIEICLHAETTSGISQVGRVEVPFVKPDVLQGGYYENPETGKLTFVGATNGETLVKVPQLVPGGLLGISKEGRYPWYFRNFCKNFPSNSVCRVTITQELVGEPHINTTDLIFEEGTALEEAVVLHLKNPLLGNRCFIGTPSEPMVVKFTTGATSPPPPNTPIHGSAGSLEILDEGSYVSLTGSTNVDNAFAAPGASGCGGPQAVVVDRELDQKDALPSPAGSNTVILGGEEAIAVASAVRESEEA